MVKLAASDRKGKRVTLPDRRVSRKGRSLETPSLHGHPFKLSPTCRQLPSAALLWPMGVSLQKNRRPQQGLLPAKVRRRRLVLADARWRCRAAKLAGPRSLGADGVDVAAARSVGCIFVLVGSAAAAAIVVAGHSPIGPARYVAGGVGRALRRNSSPIRAGFALHPLVGLHWEAQPLHLRRRRSALGKGLRAVRARARAYSDSCRFATPIDRRCQSLEHAQVGDIAATLVAQTAHQHD